jgi:hypothetical protein
MQIVDLKTFLALPSGTVFTKYESLANFTDLSVKEDTIQDIDFRFSELVAPVDSAHLGDLIEMIEDAETNGASLKLDFDITQRDGFFEQKQLFAIYEKADVEAMIVKLQSCLITYNAA